MAIYRCVERAVNEAPIMLILNVMLLMAFLIMVAISLVEVLDFRHAGE